jgi:hypothetical protein
MDIDITQPGVGLSKDQALASGSTSNLGLSQHTNTSEILINDDLLALSIEA